MPDPLAIAPVRRLAHERHEPARGVRDDGADNGGEVAHAKVTPRCLVSFGAVKTCL